MVQNSVDSTAGVDVYENTIAMTKGLFATARLVMPKHAEGGAAVIAALLWGFEGNAAGKPKGGADMRVARFERRGNYRTVGLADVVWEMAGYDVLYDEASDVW